MRMTIRMTVIAAAVSLAACGSGGAATGQSQGKQIPASRLDVAGVRPGMSATDVKTTLERAGWRTESVPGEDWAGEVAEEKGRQTNRSPLHVPRDGVGTIQAVKADEKMLITFRGAPTGSLVTKIGYSAPMAGRTDDQVRTQMAQRYGAPSRQSRPGARLNIVWCTGGEVCRDFYGSAKPALLVEEDAYHQLQISMNEGLEAERAWRAGLQRAAGGGTQVVLLIGRGGRDADERLAPKTTRAAF